MLDLNYEDTRDSDFPARLTENLSYEDLTDSQQQCISVQYNQIDLGKTEYGFDQSFEGNEANLYFERMREFSEQTINDIRDISFISIVRMLEAISRRYSIRLTQV